LGVKTMGKLPDDYRWLWKCYNCNQTWSPESIERFKQEKEYELFEKDKRFTWCTCGCHLTKVSDIQRMKEEGTWKTSSSTLVETVD